ncbi:MAG: 1-deoxy-D-xylulose-5-phosphate reductoisomerase [Alphaproteobacteria bacterium]|nr:1-deoxy-D-xylulose-5-phosphate reductoisomerase [Alphaproteobacteria bacterium]
MVVKTQALQKDYPAAAPAQRSVTILGATGSVGCQTIDLIERSPGKYRVLALTAWRNVQKLAEQARSLKPEVAVIADPACYDELKAALAGTGVRAAAGPQAVVEAAQMPADWVMAAIVGAAGLPATLAAVRRGAVVAFANKETLVCAGPLMMDLAAQSGAKLLPVDSEHNAIWQVFDFDRKEAVTRLILTASGGPFRTMTRADMAAMTAAQAVKHPVWTMGAKISIDSATLMNKGLEVIEAHFLFAMPEEKIDVVVHPQSVIHSMVEYADGSVLAQLGTPDMRTPIGYTLAWPERMETPAARLDLAQIGSLTFEAPDPEKFPALRLAREAMRAGGTAPAVLNAANEVSVQAFLDGKIGFLDIERINEATLGQVPAARLSGLDVLAEADAAARRHAQTLSGGK